MARISRYAQNNLANTSFNTAGAPQSAFNSGSFLVNSAINLSSLGNSASNVFGSRAAGIASSLGFSVGQLATRFMNEAQAKQQQKEILESRRDELLRQEAIKLAGIDVQNAVTPLLNDSDILDPKEASTQLKEKFNDAVEASFSNRGLDPNHPQNRVDIVSALPGYNSRLLNQVNANKTRVIKEGGISALNSIFSRVDYQNGPEVAAQSITKALAASQFLYKGIPPKQFKEIVEKGTLDAVKKQLGHTVANEGVDKATEYVLGDGKNSGKYDNILDDTKKYEMLSFISRYDSEIKKRITAPLVSNIQKDIVELSLSGASPEKLKSVTEKIRALNKVSSGKAISTLAALREARGNLSYGIAGNLTDSGTTFTPDTVHQPGEPQLNYTIPPPNTLDISRPVKIGRGLVPPPPVSVPSGEILRHPLFSPFSPPQRGVNNGAPPPPQTTTDGGLSRRERELTPPQSDTASGLRAVSTPIQHTPLNDGVITGPVPAGETIFTSAKMTSKLSVPDRDNPGLTGYVSKQEENLRTLKTIQANVLDAADKFSKTKDVRYAEEISKIMGGPPVYTPEQEVALGKLEAEIGKNQNELKILVNELNGVKAADPNNTKRLFSLRKQIQNKNLEISAKNKEYENRTTEANKKFANSFEKQIVSYKKDIVQAVTDSENKLLRAKENVSASAEASQAKGETLRAKAIEDYTRESGIPKRKRVAALLDSFYRDFQQVMEDSKNKPDTAQTAALVKQLEKYREVARQVQKLKDDSAVIPLPNGDSVYINSFGKNHKGDIQVLEKVENRLTGLISSAISSVYKSEKDDLLQSIHDTVSGVSGGPNQFDLNPFTINARFASNILRAFGGVVNNQGLANTPNDRNKHLKILSAVTDKMEEFKRKNNTGIVDADAVLEIHREILEDIVSGKLKF